MAETTTTPSPTPAGVEQPVPSLIERQMAAVFGDPFQRADARTGLAPPPQESTPPLANLSVIHTVPLDGRNANSVAMTRGIHITATSDDTVPVRIGEGARTRGLGCIQHLSLTLCDDPTPECDVVTAKVLDDRSFAIRTWTAPPRRPATAFGRKVSWTVWGPSASVGHR
jgi:hypothetical protein